MKKLIRNQNIILAIFILAAIMILSAAAAMIAEPLSDVLMGIVLILGIMFVRAASRCIDAYAEEKGAA